MAIVRLPAADGVPDVAAALIRGGVRAVEVTLTTSGALDAVRDLRTSPPLGAVIGTGSVRTVRDVADSAAAGAQFLVTPSFSVEVVKAAGEAGLPIICGAFTPTELQAAADAGADYVKLFPASLGGPSYVRDVLAPMPDLRIVPTGGVNASNIPAYRAAGARGVAVGSALVDAAAVAARDWDELERRAAELVAAWHVRL